MYRKGNQKIHDMIIMFYKVNCYRKSDTSFGYVTIPNCHGLGEIITQNADTVYPG